MNIIQLSNSSQAFEKKREIFEDGFIGLLAILHRFGIDQQFYVSCRIFECRQSDSASNSTYSESGRSIQPMSSIFKKESNSHLILFSLHKEIIENSHSLWFQKKGNPIIILHTLRPTEAAIESDESKGQSNIRIVIQS